MPKEGITPPFQEKLSLQQLPQHGIQTREHAGGNQDQQRHTVRRNPRPFLEELCSPDGVLGRESRIDRIATNAEEDRRQKAGQQGSP
jgi:hypothetical protein